MIDAGGEVRIFLYCYVGIRARRFVCFVLTLEATMSGEVHSRCSRMLDYERAGSLSWTTGREVRRVGPRAGRFVGV